VLQRIIDYLNLRITYCQNAHSSGVECSCYKIALENTTPQLYSTNALSEDASREVENAEWN